MKSNLHNAKSLNTIFTLLFCLSVQLLFAQSVLVKGVVKAPDGNLISNVEIAPDVFTDDLGYYEFTVESDYLIEPQKVIDNLDCYGESDSETFAENILSNVALNFIISLSNGIA